MLLVGRYPGPSLLIFLIERRSILMTRVEQPKKVEQPKSKILRIGILVASLIVGVILALFSILSRP